MAKTITFINSKGEKIAFNNAAPFLYQDLVSGNNVNIYSSKGMNQDGKIYLDNTLDSKDLTLTFTVIATTEDKLISYKNKIFKTFSPKLGEGYIIYNDEVNERKLKCIVNSIPNPTIINSRTIKFLVNLTASNPFWLDLQESKEEIALWQGDFGFDLEILEEGIELGYREPSLIVNVLNTGHTECGMRVEFKALATVENPSILNVNTGEYLKINKTMAAGEIISVSTYFGKKKVTSKLNGITTNTFNYIDFQSTFLQLDVGDNLFRYDADTNVDNLEVSIYYTPQYLGV